MERIVFEHLDEARRLFGKNLVDRALSSTVNKLATQGRTRINKSIREDWRVKVGAVNRAITIRKAKIGGKESIILGTGSAIPVIDFAARQTKKGVTYAAKKSQGRLLIKSAFIATIQGGDASVFKRKFKKRFPINKKFGPAIPQMMKSEDQLNVVNELLREKSQPTLQHEIEFRIARKLAK